MKNLKAKLSMLVSISLLGAMLTAPCASAASTEEAGTNNITWKTLYEQDFSESGLTLEKLTADGWSFSGKTKMNKTNLQLGFEKNTNESGSAIFGKDLGGTYRVTATVQNRGNDMHLKFGSAGDLKITRSEVVFGGQTVQRNCDNNKNTVTVTANNGTADMKISREGKNDQEIKGVTVPTTGELGLYSSIHSTYGEYVYNIKIEVPEDYVEYKTTYTQTAKTTEEYTNQGWIYGGSNPKNDASFDVETGNNALRVNNYDMGYIIYNKNLGTDYIVDTTICTFYNGADLYFNATFNEKHEATSGFKININGEGKTYKLYKVIDGTETELVSGTAAKAITNSVFTLQIAYKDGKIEIKSANGASLSYDATNILSDNPELASGVTGQRCTYKERVTQRDFTVKQASTENELGALCASYAASDTAKTVTYSVKARNNGSAVLADAKVIVAAYGADGALVGINVPNYTGKLGQESISHSFGVTSAPAKVKAFFFDSFENIKPLTNALEETLTAK